MTGSAHAARYTALGDSMTSGVGATPANPNGFAFRLLDHLNATRGDWSLINRAVSGTAIRGVRDFQVSKAVSDDPELITLYIGINDIGESVTKADPVEELRARFESDYSFILERLRADTRAFIITATVPDPSRLPGWANTTDAQRAEAHEKVQVINAIIAEVAATHDVPVVDLHGEALSYDPAQIFAGGVHPNNAGHATIARLFEAVLASMPEAAPPASQDPVACDASLSDGQTVWVGGESVREGESGISSVGYVFALAFPATCDVTVDWATVAGTATDGLDYLGASGTALIPAGQQSTTILVTVTGDDLDEDDETFSLKLSNPAGAEILEGNSLCTIKDDDDDKPPIINLTTSATAPIGTTPLKNSTIYNKIPPISGMASDASSGVTKVSVWLYRATATPGRYEHWNGMGWESKVTYLPTSNTPSGVDYTSWRKINGWPGVADLSDGIYYVRALAYDQVGYYSATPVHSFKIVVDPLAPTVTITSPAPTKSTVYNTMPAVSGTTSDGGTGIVRVDLRLYRASASPGVYEYWNGGLWSTAIANLSTALGITPGQNTVTWSKNVGWPVPLPSGTYYLRAWAYDKAGNFTATPVVAFKATGG